MAIEVEYEMKLKMYIYREREIYPIKEEDLSLKKKRVMKGHRAVNHFPPEISEIQTSVTGINQMASRVFKIFKSIL